MLHSVDPTTPNSCWAWRGESVWGRSRRAGWVESAAVIPDLPTVIVREHMVMSAQQHTAVDVCSTVIALPVVDVMSFGPAGRPVAAREEASSIPGGKDHALT